VINKNPCQICKRPINRNYSSAKYCIQCALNPYAAANEKTLLRSGHLYVCMFENGILKVGQSSSVETRIKQLCRDDVVRGLSPVKVKTFPCDRYLYPREAWMIDRLVAGPSRQIKREWFKRTSFSRAVQIAETASTIQLPWFRIRATPEKDEK